MRNELNHIEEIENYLEGRLSPHDKALFENRLMNDEGLREEVNIQRQIAERIRTNAFKSELASFHLAYTAVPAKTFAWKTIVLNSFIGLACLGSAVASVYYVSTLDNSPKEETKQIAQTVPAGDTKKRIEAPAVDPVKEENPVAVIPPKTISSRNIINPNPERNANGNSINGYDIDNYTADYKYTDLSPVYTRLEFNAEKGTDTIVMAGSGSFIHFPGGIVVDKNGNKIKGTVEFRYREFTDPAQIAFSKMNSTWNENGKNFSLQSAGMFEVRLYSQGEEVFIQDGKSFKIDYNVKQQADSTYFLAFNSNNQQWEKKKKVEFKQKGSPVVSRATKFELRARTGKGEALGKILVKIVDAETGVVLELADAHVAGTPTAWYATNANVDSNYRTLVHQPGTYDVIAQCRGYKKMTVKNVKVFQNKVSIVKVKLMQRKPNKNVWRRTHEVYTMMDTGTVRYTFDAPGHHGKEQKPTDGKINMEKKGKANYKATRIHLFKSGASYVIKDSARNAQGGAEKGRRKKKDGAYTTAGNWKLAYEPKKNEDSGNVKGGLTCTKTGMFYCAKVVPAADAVRLKATYLDEAGKLIRDINSICMMDRKAGNILAVNSGEIIKSKDPKMVLLLTSDNRLYGMDEKEYKAAMELKTGEQVLKMTRINVSGWSELENLLKRTEIKL